MPSARSASAGIAARTRLDRETSLCLTMAPSLITPFSRATTFSASMPDKSTSKEGRASRCFRVGIRVMPPAMGVASESASKIARASARVVGRL